MREDLYRQLLIGEGLETVTENATIKAVYRGGYWYGGSYEITVKRGKKELESVRCESPEEAVRIYLDMVKKHK